MQRLILKKNNHDLPKKPVSFLKIPPPAAVLYLPRGSSSEG
jgi:hypothetical protein